MEHTVKKETHLFFKYFKVRKKFENIQIPENLLFKHCKKQSNFFGNCALLKKSLRQCFACFLAAERDIAKVFADLESFIGYNFVVKWRKSEIVDFFLVTKRFPKKNNASSGI